MKRISVWLFYLMIIPSLILAQQTKPATKEQPKAAAREKAREKDEEASLDFKKIMEEYYAAWNTMNPENADKYYSKDPDNVHYDIVPLKYAGWETYKNGVKKLLEPYATFKLIPNDDLKITRKGKIVWTTLTFHISGKTKDAKSSLEIDCRHTAIWEKTKSEWLIVHEHVSTPMPATAGAR